ncbi:hypothetical protein PL78_12160 [Yersinia entomophaga]|uniref:Uncharacterized protein n=1 Tax=Yersinia entomophaga TaxID=935293 RepID=A0ABM6BMV1_YERET|nr:hypothetical protein [Yersinia entomophaga]ANI30576.1 hypothetical protein PL78_12160 [Yersinia entomophaga]OWF87951.1 hypothetical protein B4914_09085 [Yersinia entomophaga]
MTNQLKIKDIINKIIAFCMVKGVQPEELVTAIFDNEYESIETIKKNGMVHLIITYQESIEDSHSIVKTRYIYDNERRLQIVDQKINSSPYKTQWDRNSKLNILLDELALLVSSRDSLIEVIKDTIPNELRGVIYPQLKIAC